MPSTDPLADLYRAIVEEFDDPKREGVRETPERAARAMRELLTPVEFRFTTFESQGYDQMIVDRDIKFFSLCEHHMIPFFGTCSIGYIPKDRIVGLSKLTRCVNYFAHRLNTQEYMTQNIADFIEEKLKPKGVGVIIKARHLCREMRGVQGHGEMITSCLKGIFLHNPEVREEFMKL